MASNENELLWQLINTQTKKIAEGLNSPYDINNFQYDFRITPYCWEDEHALVNVGEIKIPVKVFYCDKRFDINSKKWAKQVKITESLFSNYFDDFKLPEQVFLAKHNPLLNTNPQPVLQIDNLESEVFSYQKDLPDTSNPYKDSVKFKLLLSNTDVEYSVPPGVGLTFIEDNSIVTFNITIQYYISSPLSFCREVLNSTIVSPSLYTDYLKQQLAAFSADVSYPSKTINVIQTPSYFFDNRNIDYDCYYQYEGDVYYIPRPNLTFEGYVKQTLKGYDNSSKQIVTPFTEISEIQNKIINIDSNCNKIVFTNEIGEIDVFDFNSFRKIYDLSPYVDLLHNNAKDFSFIDFLNILKVESIVGCTQLNNVTLADVLDRCAKQDLYRLYSMWNDLNLPLVVKLRNKIYLHVYLFGDTITKLPPLSLSCSTVLSTKVPINITNFVLSDCTTNCMYDNCRLYQVISLSQRFSTLFSNGVVKKGCIITRDIEKYFNYLLKYGVKAIIIDCDTLPELYRLLGNNISKYLTSLNTFCPILVDPNVFSACSVFGDPQERLGSITFHRNLVAEFIINLQLDYVGVDLSSVNVYRNDVFAVCQSARYVSLYTTSFSDDARFIEKAGAANCITQLLSPHSLNPCQPLYSLNLIGCDVCEKQNNFYADLYSKASTLKQNNYQPNSSDSPDHVDYKYFGYPLYFLNNPMSELFSYRHLVDQDDVEQVKCSCKFKPVIKYLSVKYLGGVFDGCLIKPKTTNTVLVFNDQPTLTSFKDKIEGEYNGNDFSNITSRLTFCTYGTLSTIETRFDELIFVQYPTHRDLLVNAFNVIQQLIAEGQTFDDTLTFTIAYSKNTIEPNIVRDAAVSFNCYLSSLLNLPLESDNYVDGSCVVQESTLNALRGKVVSKLIKLNQQLEANYNAINNSILTRYNYNISKKSLSSILFRDFNKVDWVILTYAIPFKNFMRFGKWVPSVCDLGFVDSNNQPVLVTNDRTDLCLTEIGYGTFDRAGLPTSVVNFPTYSKVAFDSTIVFVNPDRSTIPSNQLLINPGMLNISDLGDHQLVSADREQEVECNVICGMLNGYPAMYSTDRGVNLSGYNFNCCKNVFVVEIESREHLIDVLNLLSKYDIDNRDQLIEVYDSYTEVKYIKIPQRLDYFTYGNVQSDRLKAFPTIIGDKFYLALNGIFYHKQCFKLSSKYNVEMIPVLYYVIEKTVSALKVDFYQLLDVIDVSDLQRSIDFFNTKHPTYKTVQLD